MSLSEFPFGPDPNPRRRTWPNRGPHFNRWFQDLPQFVRQLAAYEWIETGRFKYLNIRVDTRSYTPGGQSFRLWNENEKEVEPDDLFPYRPA